MVLPWCEADRTIVCNQTSQQHVRQFMRNTAPADRGHFPGGDLPIAVLKCLHRHDSRALASLLLTRRRELDEVARFFVDERLGVYAYAVTESLTLGGLWPSRALARLHEQWIGQQRRNTQLLDSLATIDSAFSNAGIDYLLLKGLPMAARFHGGMDHRFTWDLDLLVHESDFAQGLKALAGIGVHAPSFTTPLHRVARRVAHAMDCRRTDGLSVDLHWAFRRLPGLRFPADDVFHGQRLQELGERRYPVPSDEHVLVQVLLGIAADIDRSLCRTRSLWDAYLLLRTRPACDWPAFLRQRHTEGCLGLVVNAIALVIHRMDAADDFKDLLQAIGRSEQSLPVLQSERAVAILARPAHSLRNHVEFASWQSQPQWRYWTWWAATLPARAFFARRL